MDKDEDILISDFIPFSRARDSDGWRWRTETAVNENESKDKGIKIKRSSGVNSRTFHRDPIGALPSATSSIRISGTGSDTCEYEYGGNINTVGVEKSKGYKKSMRETTRILQQAELRVDYMGKKRKLDELEDKTVYKHWPLQEPAMQYLDELKREWEGKGKRKRGDEDESNSGSGCGDGDGVEKKHDDTLLTSSSSSVSSLWSLEPRIFAVEKSATGKRKYIVCHLGRFMHHYWRYCEPSRRHYYELIREGTPCRLYFGETISMQGTRSYIVQSSISSIFLVPFHLYDFNVCLAF